MTATSRGRVAIAVLIAALAFGAAFAVRKATAGSSKAAVLPARIVLPATPVHVSGVAVPSVALPALRRPPRRATPTQTAPAQPSTPTPVTPTPSQPSAPSGGGKGGGPVIVG